MIRFLLAGLSFYSLFAAEPTKLSFTCKEEDLTWAGLSCSADEPCPIYLELSGIAISGHKFFLAGNIHSAQTTLYSLLVSSTDDGLTWSEPWERVRGEALDHVQFHSFDTGWVSGQQTAPLPSDPFLLVTHDGGKTWRKQPVFSDGGPGAIQQFVFDSSTNGKLIVDRGSSNGGNLRYAIYETPNGGESWNVRESTNTPIKGALVPEEETNYRLHAEAKALNVQQRSGSKWVDVASFVIQIAECGKPL